MKKFLENLLKKKNAERQKLEDKRNALLRENETVETLERAKAINVELRAIGETLDALAQEINEAKEQLAGLENDGEGEDNGEGEGAERGFNPMGTYQVVGTPAQPNGTARSNDPTTTPEYRQAFMTYVQRGVMSPTLLKRTEENVTEDMGILVPNTIVQEIIKGAEKIYGQVYGRVKHSNVKGGLTYSIGDFEATVVWGGAAGTDKEHGVSGNQKAGSADEYVTFLYHIGEVRIARSLLAAILTVDVFEAEFVKVILEAFVKEMDVVIFEGKGGNQPTGIFANHADGLQKIAANHIIEFTEAEIADWKQWQKKLFAKIPLSMRKLRPMFHMTANTFESNIETIVDENNNPVAKQGYNPVTGDETATFKGRLVEFIEDGGVVKNFDEAENGEFFGIYWVPDKAYLVNSNLQFSYKTYLDENLNKYITKGLFIVDGKILDPKYIFLLKKKVSA